MKRKGTLAAAAALFVLLLASSGSAQSLQVGTIEGHVLDASGAIVLMSTKVVPGRARSMAPPGPSSTSSTSFVPVTIVMTMSQASPSAAGDS